MGPIKSGLLASDAGGMPPNQAGYMAQGGQNQQSPAQPQSQSAAVSDSKPFVMAALDVIKGSQKMILSRLNGAQDIEMELAEVAANIARRAVIHVKKAPSSKDMTAMIGQLVDVLLRLLITTGAMEQEEAKALMGRVVPLARHLLQNGNGSVQ